MAFPEIWVSAEFRRDLILYSLHFIFMIFLTKTHDQHALYVAPSTWFSNNMISNIYSCQSIFSFYFIQFFIQISTYTWDLFGHIRRGYHGHWHQGNQLCKPNYSNFIAKHLLKKSFVPVQIVNSYWYSLDDKWVGIHFCCWLQNEHSFNEWMPFIGKVRFFSMGNSIMISASAYNWLYLCLREGTAKKRILP